MDEETSARIAPIRANVWDFVSAFSIFWKGVAEAVVDFCEVVEITAIAASSETAERQEFQKTAGREIESITKGESNG